MLDKREKSHFEQVWQNKAGPGNELETYHAGDNIRIDQTLNILDGGTRLLDIGCGSGILAEQAQAKYQEVFGIDTARVYAAHGHRRVLRVREKLEAEFAYAALLDIV